ncbi:hypothetical protein C6P45_005007 [Maudiozyma exigua]|uniref:Uncharacterized protein n=1 Tax=Maudiozyma exigua TaxID=34358 RepID=A0A9P6WA76_MAUEX|nr:hypothetical protein C6P45_005007 [Kazachstania exigua]
MPTEQDDIETRPLLSDDTRNNNGNGTIQHTNQPHPTQEDQDDLRNDRILQNNRTRRWFIPIILIAAILLVISSFKITKVIKHSPSMDQIQDDVVQVSNIKINQVHIDGWRQSKQNPALDNDSGKYLQVSTQVNYTIDYDKLLLNDESRNDTENIKFIAERFIKTLCVDLNNSTTFHNVDDKQLKLANILIQDPVCVSLINGTTTPLNITVLIQPNMKNIMSILKKLLSHDYKGLELWSQLDLTLYKQSLMNFNIKLINIPKVTVDWTQLFHWDDDNMPNFEELFWKNFDMPILEEFDVTDDKDEYFNVRLKSEPISLLSKFLNNYSKWLSIPDAPLVIPSLTWYLRLPNCHDECVIDIPTLECESQEFSLLERNSIIVNNRINGPLPSELLSHVCSSDEENTVTPLTLLLNNLLNDSSSCKIELKGQVSETPINNVKPNDNMLIPIDILDLMLHELDYFPMAFNTTLNTTNILNEVTIDNMRLTWSDNRVHMVGTMIATINLSFYDTEEERIAVHNIKGDLEIYHDDTHFLSIPMKVWNKSASEIIHDDETDLTMMEITFDLNDDDMIVTDKGELSQVFNEIFFKWETLVTFDSVVDVVVESILGQIVVTGLKASGETIVN